VPQCPIVDANGRGKHRSGWTARESKEGAGKGMRDGREGGGVRRGGEISPPRSFLKVGAYDRGSVPDVFVPVLK